MQRPARSQSPNRVGSGPFGPPISRLWLPSGVCGGGLSARGRDAGAVSATGRCTAVIRHRQILPETPRLRTTTRLARRRIPRRSKRRRRIDRWLCSMQRSTTTVCLEVRGADAAAFLHAQLSRAVVGSRPDARAARRLGRCARPRARLAARLPATRALAARDAARRRRRAAEETAHVRPALQGHAGARGRCRRRGAARRRRRRGSRATVSRPTRAPNRLVRRDELAFVRVGPSVLAAARRAGRAGATRRSVSSRQPKPQRRSPRSASGFPRSRRAVADRFVAQMLNLDELGAVSFDKGCYPGQEIIARVHNLGGVKRRARRYAAPTRTAGARRAGARSRRARSARSCAARADRRPAASCSPSSSTRRPARALDVRRRGARRAAAAVRRAARLGFGLQLRKQQHVADRRRVRQQHREPIDADA